MDMAGIYCQQDVSSTMRVAVFLIFSTLVGRRNWKKWNEDPGVSWLVDDLSVITASGTWLMV